MRKSEKIFPISRDLEFAFELWLEKLGNMTRTRVALAFIPPLDNLFDEAPTAHTPPRRVPIYITSIHSHYRSQHVRIPSLLFHTYRPGPITLIMNYPTGIGLS